MLVAASSGLGAAEFDEEFGDAGSREFAGTETPAHHVTTSIERPFRCGGRLRPPPLTTYPSIAVFG